MSITLVLVSKCCSDIMAVRSVPLDANNGLLTFKSLENIFYDNFGPLHDAKFFWRYSFSQFFEIKDYMSFHTAITFSGDQRIYILLKDYTDPWFDNGVYMRTIDSMIEKDQKQQMMNKYDVKIQCGDQEDEGSTIVNELLATVENTVDNRTDSDIIAYAVRNLPSSTYFTADFRTQSMLIRALKQGVITASFLCLANILGMNGEIITCPPHKDIYFLETNTKSESTDMANMFASPATDDNRGVHRKCKPRTKIKPKYNPAQEFFAASKTTTTNMEDESKCASSSNQSSVGSSDQGCSSRRNSIDLYEEAATILGLTCSQTDDCKCIECQCHYFDFKEEIDFGASSMAVLPTSGAGCNDYYVNHNSSCVIQ